MVKELVRLDLDARERLGVPKNVVIKLPIASMRRLANDKQTWIALSKAIAVRARVEWLKTYRTKNKLPIPDESEVQDNLETPRVLRNKYY